MKRASRSIPSCTVVTAAALLLAASISARSVTAPVAGRISSAAAPGTATAILLFVGGGP